MLASNLSRLRMQNKESVLPPFDFRLLRIKPAFPPESTNLHKDEPRDLHFARIDFVPDKSLIFAVKMFDFLHDSPRDSHVAMIDFVPDPGMKLHVTRARSQRVSIMMSHLTPTQRAGREGGLGS